MGRKTIRPRFMKRALIISEYHDAHVHAVRAALKQIGVASWFIPKLRRPDAASWSISAPDMILSIDEVVFPDFSQFDLIWFRRINMNPRLDHLADLDRDPYHGSWAAFFSNLITVIRDRARADTKIVNDPYEFGRQNSKLLQLKIAEEAGLNTLPTLLSNNADHILSGFDDDFICKSFKPFSAMTQEGFLRSLTSVVDRADPPVEALAFHPAIYQPRVRSRSEMRLTVFGEDVSAFEFTNPFTHSDNPDWRGADDFEAAVLVSAPIGLNTAVQTFMSALRLEYGCFDFLKAEGGDYIFLECNPAGQFLFIEKCRPESRLLERFVRFLLTPDARLSSQQDWSLAAIEASNTFAAISKSPLTPVQP